MLSLDSSLSSLRAVDTKGVEIVVSLRGQCWALPSTDVVGVRDPSDSGMLRREFFLVDEVQLVGCLVGLAKSPLTWDAGIQ